MTMRTPAGIALLCAIAAALLVDGQFAEEDGGLSVAGVLAVALIVVPLAWVREAPFLVFGAVLLGLAACLTTLKPVHTVVVPTLVVLYTLARYGDRRRTLVLAAFSVVCVVVSVAITTHGDEDGMFVMHAYINIALTLLALAVGDLMRSRGELAARLVAEEAAQGDRRLAEERLRIAREVHDVVAHAMVAINVQAGVAEYLSREDPGAVAPALREIKRVSGEALGDLRAELGLLRGDSDAPVAPSAGLEDLEGLAAPLRAAGTTVQVDVGPHAAEVPTAVATTARRIVQEALTNVLRHAGARHAAVRVERTGDALVVEVDDDGSALVTAGRATAPAGSGNGVRGMRERAEAIGGTLQAGPAPGGDGGWRVRAVLPLA